MHQGKICEFLSAAFGEATLVIVLESDRRALSDIDCCDAGTGRNAMPGVQGAASSPDCVGVGRIGVSRVSENGSLAEERRVNGRGEGV